MSFSLKFPPLSLLVLFSSFLVGTYIVFAAPAGVITYPVTELGNCVSQQECKDYCSVASNYSKCAAYAQKAGLTKEEVPPEQRVALNAMEKGESPGQCKDEVSCRTYCDDMDNLEECIKFVAKFNLATPGELEEMRKIVAAREAGVSFPGNCKDKKSCLAYCEDSARVVECMEFAQKAGLVTEEENKEMSKILPYLKGGGTLPGGCASKESCDAYCDNDANINVCMDFAVGAGFMTKGEADSLKKVGGKGPGNCRSREACDNYCKDEVHIDECIDFAVKAGFISQEEAGMAKKFKITSGPGDCNSKAECEAFCIVNQETCSNWAKEHGMDTGEQGGQAGPGGCKSQKECTVYCTANPEDEACKKMMQDYGGAGGDQSQIPQGYSSWQEFCIAQPSDSRCTAYKSQMPPSGNGGGQQQYPQQGGDPQQYPQQSPQQGGDQSQIPQGYSSWQEFCMAQPSDSRCTAYKPQMPSPSGAGSSPSPSGGGDQSQIPQGYSSWQEFCMAQPSDSRCTAYKPQTPQQYPLLLWYQPFAAILNFILGH